MRLIDLFCRGPCVLGWLWTLQLGIPCLRNGLARSYGEPSSPLIGLHAPVWHNWHLRTATILRGRGRSRICHRRSSLRHRWIGGLRCGRRDILLHGRSNSRSYRRRNIRRCRHCSGILLFGNRCILFVHRVSMQQIR